MLLPYWTLQRCVCDDSFSTDGKYRWPYEESRYECMSVSWYCTGNIAGPFFYKESQAPRYELGIWSMVVSHLLEVVVVLTLRVLLSRENKRRDRVQGLGE